MLASRQFKTCSISSRAQARRVPLRIRCSAEAAADATSTKPRIVPIPSDPDTQVAQAIASVEQAWRSGTKLQRLELLLPLIGATDLDDWPGGIRQQFKAAQPLVEKILKALKQKEGLQGKMTAEIWDQGDATGAWYGDQLCCVLFPTGMPWALFKCLLYESFYTYIPRGALLLMLSGLCIKSCWTCGK